MSDTSEAYFVHLHATMNNLEEHKNSVKKYVIQSTLKETAFHTEEKVRELDTMLLSAINITDLDTAHTRRLAMTDPGLYILF